MAHTQTFEALFLLGTAHCGSTLLGRMLGRHSSVLGVGELMRADRALEHDVPCSCGEPMAACPFWKDQVELLASYRNDYRRFDIELYAELARRAGKRICFDVSKTLAWRSRRTWCSRAARGRSGFVLLLRDSRGVLAATKRAGGDVFHAAPKHAKWMKRLSRLVADEAARSHVLTYESLCRDAESELRALCDFVGVPWEEATLRPADAAQHLLNCSASPYLKGSNEIRRDERWRSELDAEEIAFIERAMARVPVLREHYLDAQAASYQYS